MHLIVAEKNISARRIAEILGEGKKITENKDAGVSTYSFGDTTTMGLRGHVVEIDFEPGYQNWRSEESTPRSLIDAKTIKIPTEKKIVTLLQKLAKKADRVTIATDFDTEGELIGKEAFELSGRSTPRCPLTGHGSPPSRSRSLHTRLPTPPNSTSPLQQPVKPGSPST